MIYIDVVENQIKILEKKHKQISDDTSYQGVSGVEQSCLIAETICKLASIAIMLPLQGESEPE